MNDPSSDFRLEQLRSLLLQVAQGNIPVDEAAQQLAGARAATIEGATVDLGRTQRCGLPEVIYGSGKSPELIASIAARLHMDGNPEVLVTRVDASTAQWLCDRFPHASHHPNGRTIRLATRAIRAAEEPAAHGPVAVITAGSTDAPVADEAAETLAWMDVEVRRFTDIGVAGPQRLLDQVPRIRQCTAAVVAAGMEGALPSVVAGHVPFPVIAVPTSVGYGASLGGLSALLSMLTSCASNVAVVNIDAGFKAGYIAGLVARGNRVA